jgi:hypothetical protein
VTHRLTRQEARRIAVRAQLLALPRPTEVLEVVRRLTLVQVDLTAAVAPSADLVLWSRLGSTFTPADLDDLLDRRVLVELEGRLRPAEDLALHRAEMDRWPGPEPLEEWQVETLEWVEDNDVCRLDILDVLRSEGPLPARALPDTCVRPWRSSGWNNHRNVTMMIGIMERRGEVAVASREGRERLWDLAERVHPDDPAVPAEEASGIRARRRLAALGVARPQVARAWAEPNDVGEVGEPAVIEGLRGQWRVDPEQLDQPFEGRAALLSPLDRLVFDRKRMAELFEFDYQLEMYKPAAARRWGYWAMPVLHGDRLVGKLDASADQRAGVLRVHAVHEDGPHTARMRADIRREVRALADWLGLELRDESRQG